uniref:2-(3-amino-3-carboxypropyl)histidine synthase subunit 2 n=1 Tax=Steinernema glaseri TaxID=37863 RepID=A0A1I7YT80_9BILA
MDKAQVPSVAACRSLTNCDGGSYCRKFVRKRPYLSQQLLVPLIVLCGWNTCKERIHLSPTTPCSFVCFMRLEYLQGENPSFCEEHGVFMWVVLGFFYDSHMLRSALNIISRPHGQFGRALMTSHTKLYSDDHIGENAEWTLSKADQLVSSILEKFTTEEKRSFFEIERCGKWIHEHGCKRVALQLPDTYLGLASFLSAEIERITSAKTFVLADTSYRSCCVDHIAAEHGNADSLIHFGDACLSDPSDKLPVLYIFGKLSVPHGDLESGLPKELDSTSDTRNVVVLVDTLFSDSTDQIVEECRRSLPEFNVTACSISQSAEFRKFGRTVPEALYG